jgi:hypothetical protein
MSLVSWYDVPLALLAGLCFVLAWQDSRRGQRNHARRQNVLAERALRADEDNAYFWALQSAQLNDRQPAGIVSCAEAYGYSIRVPNQTRIVRKVEA